MSSSDDRRSALKNAIDKRRKDGRGSIPRFSIQPFPGIKQGEPGTRPFGRRPGDENRNGLTQSEQKRLSTTQKTGQDKKKLRNKLQATTYWQRQAMKGNKTAMGKVLGKGTKPTGQPDRDGGIDGKQGKTIFKNQGRPVTKPMPLPEKPTSSTLLANAARRKSQSLLTRR